MSCSAFVLIPLVAWGKPPASRPTASTPSIDTVGDRVTDSLDRVLGLARACAVATPYHGLGRDGSPLLLRGGITVQAGGDAWVVGFGETNPTTPGYGLQLRVEPDEGMCDGVTVDVAVVGGGPSLASLFDAAFACASGLDGGRGVGGSMLVERGLILTVGEAGQLWAHVPERDPSSVPSGRDVGLRFDGSGCRAAVMD